MGAGADMLVELGVLLGSILTPCVRAKFAAERKSSAGAVDGYGVRNRKLIVGLLLNPPLWTVAPLLRLPSTQRYTC